MNERSQRRLLAICAGLGMLVASCSSTVDGTAGADSTATGSFPTSISAANGTVLVLAHHSPSVVAVLDLLNVNGDLGDPILLAPSAS